MAYIEARGLHKTYGATVALDRVDLQVEEGRIVGLTAYAGHLRVLGRDPWTERDRLARDVCFITDVAVLPRWIRVSQALDFVAGIHPRFDRAKAEAFLAK